MDSKFESVRMTLSAQEPLVSNPYQHVRRKFFDSGILRFLVAVSRKNRQEMLWSFSEGIKTVWVR
jgi:hypothetical protein